MFTTWPNFFLSKQKGRIILENNIQKKEIFKYIGPGIIGLLFNSLYIIIDGIFVSQILGSHALAAVTLVVPVVEVLIAISLMISIGTGIYISLYKGKGNYDKARNYFNNGLLLTIVLSISITIIFLSFNKIIIKLLGATEDISKEAEEYFFWFTIFIPFFMLNYSLGTWIRNDDKPKLAMIAQVIGAIINIVLDYILMSTFKIGIKGAAIATGLGPIIGILIVLPNFLKKDGDLYFEKTTLDLHKLSNIFISGLPSFAIEFSLGITTFFCNIFIVSKFKEAGLASFGVIGYINLITLSIYLGIGQGIQPLISRYYGQKKNLKIHLIYKFIIKFSIIIGIVIYIFLLLTKKYIIYIFINPKNVFITKLTSHAINLFFITLSITGVNIITASIFEAKQNIRPSIIISISRSIVCLLPSLLILSKLSNPMLIWLAVPLAELMTILLSIYLYIDTLKIDKVIN